MAAGAAMVAADAVTGKGDGPKSLFALIRPPGHHARPEQAMGFCLFNNAGVAARYAREELGIEVAVLDWDVHHGNGTQDILYADPSVLFISSHQWPLYPGTGWAGETGEGEGEGFTVNLPMPAGSGDFEHLDAMDRIIEPVLEQFDPGLLIVSAGQDGHAADQLANQMLTAAGYQRAGEPERRVRRPERDRTGRPPRRWLQPGDPAAARPRDPRRLRRFRNRPDRAGGSAEDGRRLGGQTRRDQEGTGELLGAVAGWPVTADWSGPVFLISHRISLTGKSGVRSSDHVEAKRLRMGPGRGR